MEELRRVLGDLNNRLEDINLRKQNVETCSRKVVRREVINWLEKKKIEEVKELILQQGSFPDDIAIDQPPSSGMRLPAEDARGRTNVKEQIWGFSFEDVGIPKPTQQNGCKVVITSRSIELCNYIDCEQVIRMQQLSKEESLNLFLDTLGHDVPMKIPNLEETLKLVVAECGGLPLAIVVIARSMRGENDISAWRYALYVPSLAKLKALKKLDLNGTGIENVPQGLEMLVNLQYLNLDCPNQVELPIGVLCNLTHLQFLAGILKPTSFAMKAEKDQKFPRYWIRVGVTDATVKVFDFHMSLYDFEIRRDYNKLLSDFRYCDIDGCKGLECILDFFSSSSPCSSLEILELQKLPDLQVIVKVEVQLASAPSTSRQAIVSSIFSNLKIFKIFKISYCSRIKKLFPSEQLKGLQNMEEIDVFNCPKLEEIIEVEEEKETPITVGNNETITIALPKLRKLRLTCLPKLKSICTARGVIGSTSLQTLEIDWCPMLNRIPLFLSLLPNGELSLPPPLQEIRIESRGWWESLVWDNPSTKDIFLPFLKPNNDSPFLEKGFHDLQDFNNFVKSFNVQKLTWYQLRVEATDDNDGGNSGSDDDSYCNSDYDSDDDCSKMCCGMKSLNEAFVFKALSDLRSCQIKQCDKLECMPELFSSSSVYGPFGRLSILKLTRLPHLCVLVNVEGQAASAPSTSCAPTQPSIFCNLKFLLISDCLRIKKLFPSELLKAFQNLEKIYVISCAKMVEIIEMEEGKETLMTDRGKETITFILPKLERMGLMDLPNLKSICSTRGVMVCDSLQNIEIGECPKLKRIPLYLPVLPNGQLSPLPSLKEICIESREREWWEALVWDNPSAKVILLPFLDLEFVDK
ncbi:hypothetical protein SLEP1_g15351 [Rubroshorea leprosula]|uniref:NB-ARC domain-containing protein n=1 Tax=Rubroshorea leprosula TaxID=152421 RepID=A0AAV5IRC4_9ROSI|nr:hypothetical protein SLEP1_g15351 [Rubroshorea leprosula]